MLRIWGRPNSVNVKKALWAAEELGLEYERIDAGMEHGVVGSPEYRALNPNGLVPTMDDGGFILWESHAIVRYLAAKHPERGLWIAEPRARADNERWMEWSYSFQAQFRPVFWGLVRTPPEKRDMKAIEEARAKCAQLLAVPDAALRARKYLGGEALGTGDIPLGCHVQLWMRMQIERPEHPGLSAWFERLCARPAFRKIVDIPLS